MQQTKRFGRAALVLAFALSLGACGSDPENENNNNGNNTNNAQDCGNGTLDADEQCDPGITAGQPGSCPSTCTRSDVCRASTLVGRAADCTARCEETEINTCAGGDGCCPSGCAEADDVDCSAACMAAACGTADDGCCPGLACDFGQDTDCTGGSVCGNGALDAGELCDPAIVAGQAGACPTACVDEFDACRVGELSGAGCNVACNFERISQCIDGDGCCAAGCDFDTDTDCPGVTLPGEACVEDRECVPSALAGGLCFGADDRPGYPGGFCAPVCLADADCPGTSGSHCFLPAAAQVGFCVPNCAGNDDCRGPEYECFDADDDAQDECLPVASGTASVGDACDNLQACAGRSVGYLHHR